MKNQPKEVDEFAETEVLDSSSLEALGVGEKPDTAALYDEYSQLQANRAKQDKKRGR